MDKKTNTLMQNIRDAASKLKGCKLKRLGQIAHSLKLIIEQLGFESDEEAIAFVAIFDRQCAGRNSDLDDISNYIECSALDVMQFVPAINTLVAKGYLAIENRGEALLTRKQFAVCPDILYAIIEGRKVDPVQMTEIVEYDQFDFCEAVSKLKEDRSDGRIETRKLFICIQKLESEHEELSLVANLKGSISDIESRALFYEMCNDFVTHEGTGGNAVSDINETLKDFYDRIIVRVSVKDSILKGTHPLIQAQLIHQTKDDEMQLTRKGIKFLYGDKSDAILKSNKVADRYELVKRIYNMIDDLPHDFDYRRLQLLENEVYQAERDNAELSFVSKIQTLFQEAYDIKHRMIFYVICNEFLDGETYPLCRISDFCTRQESIRLKSKFQDGSHPLVKKGIVEVTEGGFLESVQLQLTDKGKEIFLEEDIDLFENKVNDKDLVQPEKIDEKQLFFEKDLQEQLSMLRDSLVEEYYQKLCNRLEENNLPKGVAILLYGKPGTGKTETAMQIARATGRAIMHVDIASTKTCWFGESEKLIKGVFTKYRKLCEKSKIKPILLFNEADAVLSKRKDSNSSNVAQTENAIQNIILEEMEKLDGILIATTNLAGNLDHAFERRFLFKIRYDNPTIEAKKNIWMDKLPCLSENDAQQLASTYDFSGGQIDNIVRRSLMEEIIKGEYPTLPTLMSMCSQEKISGNGRAKIGF